MFLVETGERVELHLKRELVVCTVWIIHNLPALGSSCRQQRWLRLRFESTGRMAHSRRRPYLRRCLTLHVSSRLKSIYYLTRSLLHPFEHSVLLPLLVSRYR